LKELREKVPVPLVLHGGSGTGDENLAKACKMGICKLNIAYDLYRGALDELAKVDMSGNAAYGMYQIMGQGIKNAAMHAMEICGSVGKA
ncbi:MAG: class II fructose-bisphosphate aldolase, partial [Lawsonibacter sp.]|nr:class II fructose-bisphosphate aldolase [Lawsonibacter sp.]